MPNKEKKMSNLTLAEKDFARDIYALLIRHKLKLVRCEEDNDVVYISNGKEDDSSEENIFVRFDSLAEQVGIKTR